MPSYGRQTISGGGGQIMVLATLESADWKPAGITVDWTTVPVAASGITLDDGIVVPSGARYLRYGTVMTKITTGGKFGPYASGASDGRQTLARGACYVLNETVLQDTIGQATDHPAVFDGGLVFKDRLLLSTNGTGPTLANFETAFPRIEYAQD